MVFCQDKSSVVCFLVLLILMVIQLQLICSSNWYTLSWIYTSFKLQKFTKSHSPHWSLASRTLRVAPKKHVKGPGSLRHLRLCLGGPYLALTLNAMYKGKHQILSTWKAPPLIYICHISENVTFYIYSVNTEPFGNSWHLNFCDWFGKS